MARLTSVQITTLDVFESWFAGLDFQDKTKAGFALDATRSIEILGTYFPAHSFEHDQNLKCLTWVFGACFLIRTIRLDSSTQLRSAANYFYQNRPSDKNLSAAYSSNVEILSMLRRVGAMTRYNNVGQLISYFDLKWVQRFAADVEAGGTLEWMYQVPLVIHHNIVFKHTIGIVSLQKQLVEDKFDHNLRIWFDWLEAVLNGENAFGLKSVEAAASLAERIVLGGDDGEFHQEFWDREPGEINREITEWVEQAQAEEDRVSAGSGVAEVEIPAQSIEATMFGLTADGRIARVAVPPEQQLLITPQQQLEYQALREDTLELAGRGQVLGQVGVHVDALLLSLPSDMSHARVFDVWRALNRLRRTMNAHQRVADFPEPHEAKLEPAIAEDLAALLRTANIFAFGDPGLLRRDELAIAPQDRPALQAEKALGDALAAAAQNTPEMFTDDALGSVVAEEANAAGAGDDPHGQQAIDQTNKTRRNWIAALLAGLQAEGTFAWKEMRSGVYKKTGEGAIVAVGIGILDAVGVTAVYPAIWKFVSTQGANLLNYVKAVYQNPNLTAYIEQVLRAVGL